MFSLILFYQHQLVLRIRSYQLVYLDFVILHENVRLHLPLFEQLHLAQSHVHVKYLLIEEVFLFLLLLIQLLEYLLIYQQHERFLHLLQLLALIDYLLEHEILLELLILEFLFLIQEYDHDEVQQLFLNYIQLQLLLIHVLNDQFPHVYHEFYSLLLFRFPISFSNYLLLHVMLLILLEESISVFYLLHLFPFLMLVLRFLTALNDE